MKYHIPGTYHSEKQHQIVETWIRAGGDSNLRFLECLRHESGSETVRGNFEDGWTIEFDDEQKYTWFLLKWGKS